MVWPFTPVKELRELLKLGSGFAGDQRIASLKNKFFTDPSCPIKLISCAVYDCSTILAVFALCFKNQQITVLMEET